MMVALTVSIQSCSETHTYIKKPKGLDVLKELLQVNMQESKLPTREWTDAIQA